MRTMDVGRRMVSREMSLKRHPTLMSGGDRKALRKELQRSRGVTLMLAKQSEDLRSRGEAMIKEADRLSCESWNERMWADGEPIDPSPTVDQAVNGGFPWLQIECSRCRTPRDIDLAALRTPPTTCIHDLTTRLRCEKCRSAGKRPSATLQQLAATKRTMTHLD